MCSKALLFAGDPKKLADTWAQADYQELIDKLKALPEEAFVPEDGPLARLMREVEGLSEEYGVDYAKGCVPTPESVIRRVLEM